MSFTSSKETALNFMKINGKKNSEKKLILFEIEVDIDNVTVPIELA
jgi:hypothetical protein